MLVISLVCTRTHNVFLNQCFCVQLALSYCFISNFRLAGLSVAPDFKEVVHRDLHDSADLVII